jgi:hypothetical protein
MSVREVLETIQRHLVAGNYDYVVRKTPNFIQLFVTKNKKLVMTITIIPHKKNSINSQNLGDTRGY